MRQQSSSSAPRDFGSTSGSASTARSDVGASGSTVRNVAGGSGSDVRSAASDGETNVSEVQTETPLDYVGHEAAASTFGSPEPQSGTAGTTEKTGVKDAEPSSGSGRPSRPRQQKNRPKK